jgi:prepilin-type N-terminal cleavage/methylation domain-containing protein
MTGPSRKSQAGFTLAELLVASTMLAIVMAAVYTSFNASLNMWRLGARNFEPYQDARIALDVMTREMHSLVRGTEHTLQGDSNEIEFYTIGPPMDVDEGFEPRVLWVKYELDRGGLGRGKSITRTEALVKGQLPLASLEDGEPEFGRVSMGRKTKFVLAEGVEDLELTYWWVPQAVEESALSGTHRNRDSQPIEEDRHKEGWGLPQGVKIVLTMEQEDEEIDEIAFSTFVAFRGRTTLFDGERGRF